MSPWSDFARTDFAANDAMRTGRGDHLVERDELIKSRPFNLGAFAEASTAASAWSAAADLYVRVPEYAIAGWFLHGRVWVKVAAGSDGRIRLQNVTDANDGTAQTGISGTSYAWSDDLSVQVDAGEHSLVNVKVQIWGDGANLMYAHNILTDGFYGNFYWSAT